MKTDKIASTYARMRKIVFNDRFSSRFGAIFFTFWIGQRVYFNFEHLYPLTIYALTWWLITFQFCIFVFAYLTRFNAREHAHGFIEVIFPFICAAMPFALIMDYPFRPTTYDLVLLRPLSTSMVIGGTLIIMAGVFCLRRSFSIMTEVRRPVYGGIYRWTRHPMYVGSMLTALGAFFQNFSWWNGFILIIFCLCQIYRAHREEIKIIKIFDEYETYATKVGWLWKIGRRKSTQPV